MKQIIRISFFLFCLFSISKSWGQLPSLNFGSNGNASGCAPHTVVFSIGSVSSNTANTTYQLNFGDGSPVLNYTQSTVPSSVSHTFTSISCGQTFGGQQNCYGATLTAINTQGATAGTVFPIRISKKPNSSFALSSSSLISGSNITFTNISDPGVTYSGTTCNTNPAYYWAVTGPSVGTVVSGTLGSNNTFPANINAWTSGSSPLTMQFTTSGSYQMKLSTGNSCGIDDTTLNFQVVNNACLLSVQDVNYCNTNSAVLGVGMQLTLASVPITNSITSYSWTGPNGFTSNAQNPIIPSPVNPGNYTLTIQAPGCVSNASDNTINVSTTSSNCPIAAFTASPAVVCDGATTTFTNQTTGAGNSYFWLFGDGSTSTLANPTHVYNVVEGTGTISFTATLVVTNSAGRMDIVQQVITVRQIPSEPTITSNQLQLYNGQEYLVSCTDDPTGDIFLSGVVSSAGSWIQSNSINWGDGSPVFNFTTFPVPCFHSYNKGLYTLQIILNGPNGCSVSNTYSVFVGGTPAISLGVTGSTEQCAPFTFNFPISNTANNSAGTTYTVTFSDGGPTQVFNHPPPAFVSHTFTQSSCGETSPIFNYPDAFSVKLLAQNPCSQSSAVIEPIRISAPPTANFTALPTTACVNNPVSINNSADPGKNVNSFGCNTNHGMVWSISPATGWSLTSGTLGGTNGQPTNYLNWTNGSNQLSLTFLSPGNYTITQRIRNSCGEDVETKTVCVVPPVTAAFNLDFTDQCAPETITTDNLTFPINTCAPPTYLWSINPLAPFAVNIPPFTSASFEPAWLLTNNGSYTITLSATNACGTTLDDTIFSIVAPPIAADAGTDQGICLNAPAVNLNGIPSGGIWSGNSLVNSEGVFSPNTVGSYSLVYSIGAGSCLVSDEVNIQVIAPPTVAFALEDTLFCTSDAVITLTSGTPTGGVYFGSGVNGNQFDPSLTFVGESTIGYSYTDFNGCSNLVNENIAVEICAFIANSEMSKSFHVYPNPSSGIVNIQLQEGCSFAEMTLFSLDGQLIAQKQLNASTQSFDFSVLSSGVYFIQLQNKEEIISLPWYKFN